MSSAYTSRRFFSALRRGMTNVPSPFVWYRRVILITFCGVLLIAAALLYWQYDRAQEDTLRETQRAVASDAAVVNHRVEIVADFLETMRDYAQSSHPPSDSPGPLYRQLVASRGAEGFSLDLLAPPFTRGMAANITGTADLKDPGTMREIEMSIGLNPLFTNAHRAFKGVRWVYYLSARGFINLYPWVPSSAFRFRASLLEQPHFAAAAPRDNPNRQRIWTEPFRDAAGAGWMATGALPVYGGDVFLGIVAIDLSLAPLSAFLASRASYDGAYYLVSEHGVVLAQGRNRSFPHPAETLGDILPQGAVAMAPRDGGVRLTTTPDRFIFAAGLSTAPWTLLYVVDRRAVCWQVAQTSLPVVGALLIGLTLMLIAATRAAGTGIVAPAQDLLGHIDSGGRATAQTLRRIPPLWRPWFEMITKVFDDQVQLVQLRRELEIAREMQQAILPHRFPDVPGLHLTARMRPAREVGGDFYDFFWLGEGRLGLVIADVSDKGVPAALFMAVSHTLLRAVASTASGPAACLAAVNRLLAEDNEATMFVTMVYATFDCATRELRYAIAGHERPLVRAPSGKVFPLTGPSSVPLGIAAESVYADNVVTLETGAILLFFTDGLIDAVDATGGRFGHERTATLLSADAARDVEALATDFFAAVDDFAGETPAADDISCLVLHVTGQDASPRTPETSSEATAESAAAGCMEQVRT